jgi:hypothetical protein
VVEGEADPGDAHESMTSGPAWAFGVSPSRSFSWCFCCAWANKAASVLLVCSCCCDDGPEKDGDAGTDSDGKPVLPEYRSSPGS